jgi:two-component system phosphate regulon sensor histidine kinase PhoR
MGPIEKMILNSMNEGVITVECDGKINTVNPSALRILDLVASEVVGRRFEEVFPDSAEHGPMRKVFSNVVHEGVHALHEEIQYKREDGQTVDLAVASSALEIEACTPGLQSVVIVFRDITAFKSIERARRKAVDRLSHELKTPLAIIKGYVSTLVRNEPSAEKSRMILRRIEQNVKRLIDIQAVVEEILNPPPYRPVPLAVAEQVNQVLGLIRQASSHRSVSLVTHLEDIQTDIIDPYVLDTILQTLVKNAIERTPDQGEVVISLRDLPPGILVEVTDHGVGIPVGDEEFIFDGFHHVQPTDEYSTRKPYDFNAGGKGLELLRLKVLSESCPFDISFKSLRCKFIPTRADHCPGRISSCVHVRDEHECKQSSGTTFSVLFYKEPVGAA